MSDNNLTHQQAVMTLSQRQWDAPPSETTSAVEALEQGKVLFFPQLSFVLDPQQMALLDPALVDPKRKNISYKADQKTLNGVAQADKKPQVQALLDNYYHACKSLIANVLPEYKDVLHTPTNSLRLHPVTAWRNNSSWRKDDSRLHVDAFPSRPNYGQRILRIFNNINPQNEDRIWRVGEPFPELAQRFLPKLGAYSPFSSWIQNKVGITKSRRSHYDHLMLQMHDKMKFDSDYQQNGRQLTLAFPPGSTWVCFSDQTPHAAMSGQFMLEQTFLLEVDKMKNPATSPLKTLESLTSQRLI